MVTCISGRKHGCWLKTLSFSKWAPAQGILAFIGISGRCFCSEGASSPALWCLNNLSSSWTFRVVCYIPKVSAVLAREWFKQVNAAFTSASEVLLSTQSSVHEFPGETGVKPVEEAPPVVGRWKFHMNELGKWRQVQVTVEDQGNITAGWSESS